MRNGISGSQIDDEHRLSAASGAGQGLAIRPGDNRQSAEGHIPLWPDKIGIGNNRAGLMGAGGDKPALHMFKAHRIGGGHKDQINSCLPQPFCMTGKFDVVGSGLVLVS